jgi:hypothetical protein
MPGGDGTGMGRDSMLQPRATAAWRAGYARRLLAQGPQSMDRCAQNQESCSHPSIFPRILSDARSIRLTIDGPDDTIPINWRPAEENDQALDQNRRRSQLAGASAGRLAPDHQWT